MSKNKRIIFFGTPDFASAQLENLIHSGFEVVAVVTAQDKPAGRGKKLKQSAVKKVANQFNLPVMQPERLKDEEFIQQLKSFDASVFIVIAFRMIPEKIWRMPSLGTFNLHASLLPQYRGAAPINRAIMNGENQTGLTTFFIDANIDEGNIIQQLTIDIGANETAGELHDRMIDIGKPLLIDTLEVIFNQTAQTSTQRLSSFHGSIKPAPKIFKHNCEISWEQPIATIFNQIRGLSPYPAAVATFTTALNQTITLKIFQSSIEKIKPIEHCYRVITDNKYFLKVVLPDGYLCVLKVQQSGKKAMDIADFLRGYQFIGEWFINEQSCI